MFCSDTKPFSRWGRPTAPYRPLLVLAGLVSGAHIQQGSRESGTWWGVEGREGGRWVKPKDLPVQGVLSGCPHSLSWESDWNSRGSKRDSINKATARKHAPSSAQMMESVVSMQTVPAGGVCGHLLPPIRLWGSWIALKGRLFLVCQRLRGVAVHSQSPS